MKKLLLITLLLISPFSFADWGDVYYCQMTTLSETTLEGKRTDYILEKFQFKLDKTKNAMVFGKQGYFKNAVLELREELNWPVLESWYAKNEYAMAYFDKGKFLYVRTGIAGSDSISADCDKF
tara:strand:+ start:109 stop:477 length:369 start_codon:yes stop_codon:yes gene_type:complete